MHLAQPQTQISLRYNVIAQECSGKHRPSTTTAIPINNTLSQDSEIHSSIVRKSVSVNEQFIKNQEHFIPATFPSTSFARTSTQLPDQFDSAKKKSVDEDSISTHCKVQSGQITSSKIIQNPISFRKINPVSSFKQDNFMKKHNHQLTSRQQLYKTFEYTSQFQQIKKIFKQQLKKVMTILKENENMILMRKRHTFSYKCIVTLCLPAIQDEVVYELKKCQHSKNRARLQLLSGNVKQFQIFKKSLLSKLWQQKKLNTNQIQALQYFFHLNNKTFLLIQEEISAILSRRLINQKRNSLILLPYSQANNTQQRALLKILQYTKSILYVIKYSTQNFKKKVAESQQFDFSPLIQKKIQSLIFELVCISKLYLAIYEEENRKIGLKKRKIKKEFTLIEVFEFLEVKEQHRLLNQNNIYKNYSLDKIPSFSVMPFWEAIQVLECLNIEDPPSVLLSKIQQFSQNLKVAFNKYSISIKVLELDMDSLLPLIIYCILISTNDHLIAISKMMLDFLQFQDCWQAQKKMFTTIQASFNYIRIEWKVQKQIITNEKMEIMEKQ